MKSIQGLAAGLAGAVVLTVTHQLLHKMFRDAPRMDLMGEEAVNKITDKAGIDLTAENTYNAAMTGDIAGNALYYSLAYTGNRKNALQRGALLGLTAGIGAVVLPKHMGLSNEYSNRTIKTGLLAIAVYTLGGIVSGKVAGMLSKRE